MRYWLAAVLVLLVFLPASSAAPRTWKSSGGSFSIEAELVEFKDGKVQLRKADGKVITVPLEKLSEADRRFVEEQAGKSEEPSDTEPDAAPDSPASESEGDYRIWTSKGGSYTLEAELLSFEKGKVELRKRTGDVLTVELKKLCLEDYRFVRRYIASTRESTARSSSGGSSRRPGGSSVELSKDGATTLELERHLLDPPRRSSRARSNPVTEYLIGVTSPQEFYARSGQGGSSSSAAAFGRIVSKEPKYQSAEPFRGVARLGSQQYAFALDAVDAKTPGYGRLYFDTNHNGDLTDEKPVDAVDGTNNRTDTYVYARYQFPRVEVKVETDGGEIDYAFLLSNSSRKDARSSSTYAYLYAAAFREGYIGRGRNRTCLVLVDSNSNGRFDDKCSIRSSSGRVYTSYGDVLLINPNPKDTGDTDRLYLSKLVCIGERFYELEVSPAGDEIKFSPSAVAVGYVTNPSPSFSATVYSDEHGMLNIGGDSKKRIPLPAGEWKLASYTINATQAMGPAARGGTTRLSASATGDYQAVEVTEKETAPMPFGAPFRPVVKCTGTRGGKASLSLSIVGTGGERCTGLTVGGRRPPGPQFVIMGPDDKVVEQGKFKYG